MASLNVWLAIGAGGVSTALFFGLSIKSLRSGWTGFIVIPAAGVSLACAAFIEWWASSSYGENIALLEHGIWIGVGSLAGVMLGYVLGGVWGIATRISALSRDGRSGRGSKRIVK